MVIECWPSGDPLGLSNLGCLWNGASLRVTTWVLLGFNGRLTKLPWDKWVPCPPVTLAPVSNPFSVEMRYA